MVPQDPHACGDRTLSFAWPRQERLAAGLAVIAGFVDAYGIITYNTYVSFMSTDGIRPHRASRHMTSASADGTNALASRPSQSGSVTW